MTLRFALGILALAMAGCQQPLLAAERAVLAPPAARPAHEVPGLKRAVFSGGCFWGVEGVFSHVNGVTSVVSGYHGGHRSSARYEIVSAGNTGHAESVLVTYDPSKVRYDELLRIFFSVVADPTQLNRQGPDSGSQYHSAIVPMTEEQRLTASAYLAQLRASGLWKRPIVTRIERYRHFYPAEGYHQDFIAKNPNHPYIKAWDLPKIEALRRLFPSEYHPGFTLG